MHAKVANSNPTNYIFLRSAINTLSIEYIKNPFFQNLKIGLECLLIVYLIQNSQAVKKVCGPQKGYGEKRCEIQGGGQEMAVMVG